MMSKATEQLAVSFEFFPPKPGESGDGFWRTIRKLETVAPRFGLQMRSHGNFHRGPSSKLCGAGADRI